MTWTSLRSRGGRTDWRGSAGCGSRCLEPPKAPRSDVVEAFNPVSAPPAGWTGRQEEGGPGCRRRGQPFHEARQESDGKDAAEKRSVGRPKSAEHTLLSSRVWERGLSEQRRPCWSPRAEGAASAWAPRPRQLQIGLLRASRSARCSTSREALFSRQPLPTTRTTVTGASDRTSSPFLVPNSLVCSSATTLQVKITNSRIHSWCLSGEERFLTEPATVGPAEAGLHLRRKSSSTQKRQRLPVSNSVSSEGRLLLRPASETGT